MRNLLIADFDQELRSKLTLYFLSKKISVLVTDLRGFNAQIIDNLNLSLAIIADPDEIPGGRFLLDQLKVVCPDVPIIIICSNLLAVKKYLDGTEGPGIQAICRTEHWDSIMRKTIEIFLLRNRAANSIRKPRRDVQIPVVCEILGHSQFLQGEIKNVSRTGAYIESIGVIPKIGEAIEVEFEGGLVGANQVHASGLVRWSSQKIKDNGSVGFGVEIAFFDCDERDVYSFLELDACT